MSAGKIHLLGFDCGKLQEKQVEELNKTTQEILASADIICGFKANILGLANLTPLVNFKAQIIYLQLPLSEIVSQLKKNSEAGHKTVVIVDGDPMFYGLGQSLMDKIDPNLLIIHPALSSLQLTCARLKLPLNQVQTISLHGRDLESLWPKVALALNTSTPLMLLGDNRTTPKALAEFCLQCGAKNYVLHILGYLGTKREEHLCLTLEEALVIKDWPKLCTLTLLPTHKTKRPHLGLPASYFQASPYHTQLPVRASALALLEITPESCLWDVGSGSGSLALEAYSLAYAGQVIAIEKDPLRAQQIKANAYACGALGLKVLEAQAPKGLETLPDPSQVFIGGGLSKDDALELLETITQRLKPEGHLVVSCVLFKTLQLVENFLKKLAWPLEIMQIQSSKAKPLANDWHFQAQNPVFLLSSLKP
ncbi:MAG: precorrin-6y C5,15-methyltransferase (decarboxylating) subunit CbiE [Desulfovibrionaceae bacterium]|nr:precorrin-6y C5,15-methyltransferase (decarboxylating) subunit CbiE [Desulfovibrionaceae bacterium]